MTKKHLNPWRRRYPYQSSVQAQIYVVFCHREYICLYTPLRALYYAMTKLGV